MRMLDIIDKKKYGKELSKEEISFFVSQYVAGQIPDYQASALLMAIYFQGMNGRETAALTQEMANSGDMIDLSDVKGNKVDKHSTGGVGDKTTLVVAPIVAACGLPVAKMSGRGLGHTGGTIDKLEAIKGYQSELSKEAFIQQVNLHKLAIISQSGNLTPADKKLYALRDVTGTVDSIPLIASSIMSKKIAAGANAIVLDVKYGSGAFMKTITDAEALAECMVTIGESLGRRTVAVISNMEQPLGKTIGNSIEVLEAIQTLQGKGPEDLLTLSTSLAIQMLLLGNTVKTEEEGIRLVEQVIADGTALECFYTFLKAQGVTEDAIGSIEEDLVKAQSIISLVSWQTGFIHEIIAEDIGRASMMLGSGRETKESIIDPFVGIHLHKKVGDFIEMGECLCEFHCNKLESLESAQNIIKNAIRIENKEANPAPLIYKIIKRQ